MKKTAEKEFDEIFWQHKDMVYHTALKYFKNSSDSEEIVQEVFLKVYMHFHKFRKESSLKTWIYRIALNEIFTRFRKEKKHQLNVPISHEIKTDNDDDMKNIEMKELENKFHDLIKNLPKKRGNVVFLRITENISFRKIGEMMEISEDSAKNLFSLGIKTIRAQMEGYYG